MRELLESSVIAESKVVFIILFAVIIVLILLITYQIDNMPKKVKKRRTNEEKNKDIEEYEENKSEEKMEDTQNLFTETKEEPLQDFSTDENNEEDIFVDNKESDKIYGKEDKSDYKEWLKDDDFFNQVRGVTYNKSSVWLQQMADPKVRENVHVTTHLSMISLDEYDTGRGYLDIAANEDLLMKFNAVRDNRMPLPTLANKRTFYFITGLKRTPVTIQNGSLNAEVIDVFTNYAINEYTTIQEALKAKNNFLERVGVSEDDWNKMSRNDQLTLMKEKGTNYKDLVEKSRKVI